jgi:hypothetical protein
MWCMRTRRQLLAIIVVLGILTSGCLTISPSVQADTSNSTTFEGFSVTESWSGGRIRTNVTLTTDATHRLGITRLVVVGESGRVFYTTSIAAGQTSATVMLPPNQNVTVVAANRTGYAIENQSVTATGNQLF